MLCQVAPVAVHYFKNWSFFLCKKCLHETNVQIPWSIEIGNNLRLKTLRADNYIKLAIVSIKLRHHNVITMTSKLPQCLKIFKNNVNYFKKIKETLIAGNAQFVFKNTIASCARY